MSSLRNAVSRRAHKERGIDEKFGLLESRLKEKAFFRNPDEFNFKMTKTRTVNGVHKLESRANKYTPEELLLMKTQDIGYIFQKVQSEKKVINTRHKYVEKEAREIQSRPKSGKMPVSEDIPDHIKRKTAGSYRELEGRRKRVNELEKFYMDMAMQKELQVVTSTFVWVKKRKVCEDEIVSPTSNAVCKWRAERKR
ncbi:U3 small nucleolar RNA-associated protein 11 [Pyrus ussuriensis x Pyrus communis]|uniref:U3 small nucleolar RNA-associated protein 11 n=1 Tax=Pyrus ussuriensis x Pyrus communis TaxID=2448454 RepID=A0A5N5GJK8_9ROSA|nr:U3 small nucleolar RNA-associated protein 11 [Pyrus ussuriensis x Pyrus communis]